MEKLIKSLGDKPVFVNGYINVNIDDRYTVISYDNKQLTILKNCVVGDLNNYEIIFDRDTYTSIHLHIEWYDDVIDNIKNGDNISINDATDILAGTYEKDFCKIIKCTNKNKKYGLKDLILDEDNHIHHTRFIDYETVYDFNNICTGDIIKLYDNEKFRGIYTVYIAEKTMYLQGISVNNIINLINNKNNTEYNPDTEPIIIHVPPYCYDDYLDIHNLQFQKISSIESIVTDDDINIKNGGN